MIVEAKFIAKEARPITNTSPIIFMLGLKPEIRNLNSLFFVNIKNRITKTAPAACPKIVAVALPSTPQSNFKTNTNEQTIAKIIPTE